MKGYVSQVSWNLGLDYKSRLFNSVLDMMRYMGEA